MRLADLVARHPGAHLATPGDNARILAFFDRAPMQTSAFALQYRRAPDFFHLLRYQGDRHHAVLFADDAGAVQGIGSFSLRPAWVDGRRATVGYLGDLRVGFHRATITRWRAVVSDVVGRSREIEELADCTHWLTTVLDENRVARRALRSGVAGAPTYAPVAPFTMRNLVARLPFARRRGVAAGRWRVGAAAAGDAEALVEFFERTNRDLPFGFRDELARRLARWDGLALGDFLLVREGAAIVACMAPWSPSRAKRTVVSRLPASMRLLRGAARLARTRVLRIPGAGEPLRIAYCTHLAFAAHLDGDARAGAFRAMVDDVFDRWESVDWHCLAVADFDAWRLGRALGGYVQQTVPITMYAALAPGSTRSTMPAGASAPAFEMATV